MTDYQATYTDMLFHKIKATPDEYLPVLLNIVRLFRESITLKSAENSFRQGWKEALSGETMPIDSLWVGIDDNGK